MSRVAAPADKRFRRAHVKPTRRRRWRAVVAPVVRFVALGAVVVYAMYRGGMVVTHARMLQVDRIVVRGNQRLSTGEVLAVLEGLRGENLVWPDLNAWRERLLASAWVKDAMLRRSLPSTVDVTLTERAPIAVARMRGELFLVDDRGAVIDDFGPQYADLDLPMVDGLDGAGTGSGPDGARADLLARLIAAVGQDPSIARRLSQVDLRDVHNATVVLAGDGALIAVGEDRFLSRLQSYLELGEALRTRVADIDYVDLRFDDRIFVRPAGKPARIPIAIPR